MLVLRLAASAARRSPSYSVWLRYADENRLKYTRAILDAIHSGELAKAEYETYETFSLSVPTSCTGVPSELLNPAKSWTGAADFKEEVTKLGGLFVDNFKKYAEEATEEVIKAGPQIDNSKKYADEATEEVIKADPQATEKKDPPPPGVANYMSHNGTEAEKELAGSISPPTSV